MKIFSATQIKEWDSFTIREQQVTSDILMERAANACFQWLVDNGFTKQPIVIFCGKGNNGGDGLALARMLLENNIRVNVHILELGKPGSNDFQLNLQKLHQATANINFIQSEDFFPAIDKDCIVIDALFGTGLNKRLEGIALHLVEHLNNSHAPMVSIDIPSGLFSDKSTKGFTTIHAAYTLSFQSIKLAFLMPENELAVGEFHILKIGLSNQYEEQESAAIEVTDTELIKLIVKKRSKFSHKGNFGHAALIAGSYGMMGAAVLAANGCMKTGSGKLTCYIPSCGYAIMQSAVPEAMCKICGEQFIGAIENMQEYDSIGIGPGIGRQEGIPGVLAKIFAEVKAALVLDADALNTLANDVNLLQKIPAGAVITPHPKEFERLFGSSSNEFERLELAIKKAAEHNIYIILKGHYTAVITPRGKIYFNDTGNAGMAKAGMGDVLTGILTGLLAQKYFLPEAAILAVHLHGLAGDIAAEKYTVQAMQASDLINCMGKAWKILAIE